MRSQKVIEGFLFVAFFVFVLQIISFVARNIFYESGICNPVGAWGADIPLLIILLLSSGALIVFSLFWINEQNIFHSYLWLILLSAGMSNLLERFFFGCIFDYIQFPLLPVFNFADFLLTAGVIIYFYFILRKRYGSNFK